VKAWEYEVVSHDGAYYCASYGDSGCLPDGVSENAEDVHPVFAEAEVDSYPVCDSCHEEHTYMGLTEEGRRQLLLRAHAKKECDDDCPICKELHDTGQCDVKLATALNVPKKYQSQRPLHCAYCEEAE
jgi:hypothetical protein